MSSRGGHRFASAAGKTYRTLRCRLTGHIPAKAGGTLGVRPRLPDSVARATRNVSSSALRGKPSGQVRNVRCALQSAKWCRSIPSSSTAQESDAGTRADQDNPGGHERSYP